MLELVPENHVTMSKNSKNAILSNGNVALATKVINFLKASYLPAAFKFFKTIGNISSTFLSMQSLSALISSLPNDFHSLSVHSNSDRLAVGFTGTTFSLC